MDGWIDRMDRMDIDRYISSEQCDGLELLTYLLVR